MHHPILQSKEPSPAVVLIHCDITERGINAELMFVEPYTGSVWIQVSDLPRLEGVVYECQLPMAVIDQPERYKAYHVQLPSARI
jgi:hypothetical protein